MADNTLPNDNARVATDELTHASQTAHVQYMKLMDGAADSTAKIGGDATNGLDVDVTRIAAGGSADLGATTDAEATGNGSVIAILKRIRTLLGGVLNVRPAAPAANDYLPVRLTDGSSFYSASGGSGGTAMVDDAAFTPGTTPGTPVFGMFDDVSPDSVNEGDGGVVRMSANRNLYVTLRDAAGNERGLNVDASGQLAVTIASVPAHDVTNAGTFAVQITGSALTALQLLDNLVLAEDDAHSTGATGLMALGVRNDAAANRTSADGDYSPLATDAAGRIGIADLGGSITVDVGTALPAGSNNIGDVDIAGSASATLATVSASVSSVSLLASNAARRMAVIYNDSAAVLYVKFGATASLTSFTVAIPPYGYFEMPVPAYTGALDGIWSAASGAARVTEY
jgi:hypothetical protein